MSWEMATQEVETAEEDKKPELGKMGSVLLFLEQLTLIQPFRISITVFRGSCSKKLTTS